MRSVFTINDTPHSIALGVSFGLFVALTPTVGFQMLIVAVIGTFIKANRIIGVILCWISNPITFIPMYYGYYWVGGGLLGIEQWTFSNFSDRMDGIYAVKEQLGYFALVEQLSYETLLPLFVGSLIIATLFSVPLYPLMLYVMVRHQKKRTENTPLEEAQEEVEAGPDSPAEEGASLSGPRDSVSLPVSGPDPKSLSADACVQAVKKDD